MNLFKTAQRHLCFLLLFGIANRFCAQTGSGTALSFDGLSAYMQIGGSPLSPPWTAEFWVIWGGLTVAQRYDQMGPLSPFLPQPVQVVQPVGSLYNGTPPSYPRTYTLKAFGNCSTGYPELPGITKTVTVEAPKVITYPPPPPLQTLDCTSSSSPVFLRRTDCEQIECGPDGGCAIYAGPNITIARYLLKINPLSNGTIYIWNPKTQRYDTPLEPGQAPINGDALKQLYGRAQPALPTTDFRVKVFIPIGQSIAPSLCVPLSYQPY